MSIISALKNCDKNSREYRLSLLEKLHSAVLNSGGDPFSFEWSVITKIVAFQRNDRGKWKEHHKCPSDGDAYTAEKVMSELGINGMYVKAYECLSDDRPYPWNYEKHDIAKVCWGYKYTFNITSEYANRLYKENYERGMAFFNQLTYNNRNNLEQLLGSNFLTPDANCDPVHAFLVTTDGVSYQYHTYIENFPRYFVRCFSQIGKTNLKDMHECYGMALAVVNFLKETRWNNCTVSIMYERCFAGESSQKSDGIRVNFSVQNLDSSKKVLVKQLEEW